MSIRSFRNRTTEDIYHGRTTKDGMRLLPVELHAKARLKLARIAAASTLHDLSSLTGNRFKALKGNRRGQYSIRINDQYRVCFYWVNNAAEEVEIVDYH